MATQAEILNFIATREPLEETLKQFPGLSREKLRAVLREAAIVLRAEELGLPEQLPTPALPERAPEPVRKTSAPVVERVVAERYPESSGTTEVLEKAPPSGKGRRLKVYSDGAARGNPGPAGAGAVILKTDGAVVAKAGKFLGSQTNNYAEYTALLLGLETALRLGANEVEIYADSELMIRQLQGRYKLKAEGLKPLFARAKELLRKFEVVELNHIPREENTLADEMSNRAVDEKM